jgi:hypothetical protein
MQNKWTALKSLLFVLMLSLPVVTEAAERKWEEGTVWTINFVKTKPGHFNSYMDEFSIILVKYLERLKKDGVVMSYKVLQVSFPRDNEPDLLVMTEYKDMAVFDRGVDYFEKVMEEVFGSVAQMEKGIIDREQMRTLRGAILTRDLKLKK